ncbi:MAG: polyprenol monophosphomannose synthase [Candidatus Hodarchaeota archaeon]
MKSVSVILPTYNERENILRLVPTISELLQDRWHEIIVVDDNSPDRTWEIVQNMNQKNVRLIRRMKNRGLTNSLNEGITEAKGSYVVWMDADFSHPPELIPDLLSTLDRGECDVAIASRFINNAGMRFGLVRQLFSRSLNLFAQILLTRKINDYSSGFVAARRAIFKTLQLEGEYGEYCIQFLYQVYRAKLVVKEIPYLYVPRQFGETKTSPALSAYIRHGLAYGWTVLKQRL